MRNALKAALFVSAFSPSLMSVGAARLVAGAAFWDAIYYVVVGAIGTLSVIYILSALKWHGEAFPFQAKKIESNDALLFGVVFTYIVPFLVRAADITLGIVIAQIAVVAAIFWFTDSAAPSPLMRVIGFRFYKAESSNGMVYTLMTNRQIMDPADVKLVKRISASMLLEVAR
jgi:hypothetical protein